MNDKSVYFLCLVLLFFFSCNQKKKQLFQQLNTTETGIVFTNRVKQTETFNLLTYPYIYNGGGVAAGDINNDGLEDLFFTGNHKSSNKLYINKGSFQFEDVTAKAGVQGKSDWCNGVTLVDMNGDGWLDIYISTVTLQGFLQSANELYLNNRNGTFTESAANYGLDFKGHTTQSVFFDYDNDGDLDCFLLNHSATYLEAYQDISVRKKPDPVSGNKLFKNNNGYFTDVTEQAGIYSSSLGYSLGIAAGDLNNDGWMDLYVSNDFQENDYCYINNGNGTFTESIGSLFGHTSRFSMGSDIADYNNDGWQDVITMDMLPNNETILKKTGTDDDRQTYDYKHGFGFHYQIARNCLQQNIDGHYFSDLALQKGVAATDWSWAPLIADFNNDGKKDLYISNGYKYRMNDQDFSSFLNNQLGEQQRQGIHNKRLSIIEQIPSGIIPDFLYLNNGNEFMDVSFDAGFTMPNLSNGAAYTDLDNDGDLDLVVNRMDGPAGVYRNEMPVNHFLNIKLNGSSQNTSGIGAKLYVYAGNEMQFFQQSLTRGFMSSVSPIIHVGTGNNKTIDSLIIIWPDGKGQKLSNITTNKTITVSYADAATGFPKPSVPKSISTEWQNETEQSGINFTHKEDAFDDLNVQPFLPHSIATQGPKTAVADVNGDGLQDVFIGGAKNQPAQLFVQTKQSTFIASPQIAFNRDSAYEDTDALFFDADNDKDMDLYVTSGGNEYYGRQELLKDRLYINDGKGNFTRQTNLPDLYENKSCVRACDFDKDGDLDLFVGGRVNARMYGYTPASVILQNDGKGNFKEVTETVAKGLINVGMVTDAHWTDLDKDGWTDLLIVGEWMPVTIFKNQKGRLVKQSPDELKNSTGWWTCMYATDIDDDGDEDFLLGNWGLNTKLTAGADHPLKMLIADWDKNGEIDPILTLCKNQDYYTFLTKLDLERRLPFLKKHFFKFTDMAGKTTEEIFGKENIAAARVLQAATLQSSILRNEKGVLKLEALPSFLQTAPVFSFSELRNKNNTLEYLATGNFYEVLPYEGRYDAMLPVLFTIKGQQMNKLGVLEEKGAVRNCKQVLLKNGEILLLLVRNNAPITVMKKSNHP
jgi:hypothetical protein